MGFSNKNSDDKLKCNPITWLDRNCPYSCLSKEKLWIEWKKINPFYVNFLSCKTIRNTLPYQNKGTNGRKTYDNKITEVKRISRISKRIPN